jgi:predicted nucleic acid-binding protein
MKIHTTNEQGFIDTSGYFSYLNARDANHSQAQSIMGRLADQGDDLYTSNFVVAETHALILTRIGREEAARFLSSM